MKKELFISFLFLIGLNVTAQDIKNDFNSFRDEVLSNYQEYRKGILDNYASYLSGVWEEYEIFKGTKKQVTPKPTVIPKADKNNEPEPIKEPEVIPANPQIKPSDDNPLVIPVKPNLPQKPIEPNDIPVKTFVFYGMQFNVPIITVQTLNSFDNSAIAKIWDTYLTDKVGNIADNLSTISRALGLNDWLQYELVKTYVESVCDTFNDRILLEHFLLSHLGFDVRLAKNRDNLALLISFDQQVYERSYLMIDGIRYYVFDQTSTFTNSYYSCQIPQNVYRGKPLELGFLKSILKPRNANNHSYHLTDGRLSVSGLVNEDVMKMIAHYPHCDISNYARSNVLPPFHKDLLRQLKPQLQGMNQFESVSVLLHFVQYAFKYATDHQQHGYEKPYFIEENFYYPMNDCEDRAVLFAFLVRNLVGLDVHLVQFPGHECTAVNFNNKSISGDSYNYEGNRYLICDPTYVGASIGQCMPDYIDVQPMIELW